MRGAKGLFWGDSSMKKLKWLTVVIVLVASSIGLLVFLNKDDARTWVESRSLKTSSSEGQLKAMWLGTAGVYIGDGESGVLLDPFVSKYSMGHVVLDRPIKSREKDRVKLFELIGNEPVDMVIVSHSHYDHVLDAPEIAKHFNVPLVGSSSTDAISKSFGYLNTVVAENGSVLRIGNFEVTFRYSLHGDAITEYYGFPGTVQVGDPLVHPSDFKVGTVYGIHLHHGDTNIVHHASASFLPDTYDGLQADVVFLGVALRENSESLLTRIKKDLDPKTIVPIHFDNFFSEDDRELLPLVHLGEFVKTAEKDFPNMKIRFAPRDTWVELE